MSPSIAWISPESIDSSSVCAPASSTAFARLIELRLLHAVGGEDRDFSALKFVCHPRSLPGARAVKRTTAERRARPSANPFARAGSRASWPPRSSAAAMPVAGRSRRRSPRPRCCGSHQAGRRSLAFPRPPRAPLGVTTSTTLNRRGGAACGAAGGWGSRRGTGRRAGLPAGGRSTLSSGRICAPVPLVSVSSTHFLLIELMFDDSPRRAREPSRALRVERRSAEALARPKPRRLLLPVVGQQALLVARVRVKGRGPRPGTARSSPGRSRTRAASSRWRRRSVRRRPRRGCGRGGSSGRRSCP